MIKKIIHIADIHIRTYQYHDMYKKQFELFIEDAIKQVSGYKHEEIRILVVGDIAHQKISISNEQLILTSWFLTELAKIGKVIIIPGNHDFLENNISRLDSITPVVELLGHDEIVYYKESGVYKDENINWVVYSLYNHNIKPEYVKEDGLYAGLFHGPVQGLSTDLGFEFTNAYSPLNFVDLDVLFCGDIHKRQFFDLPNGGNAFMIGSLIQQNFGETINLHGYGVYDVQSNKYETHDIDNLQPFLHFSITDISDIEKDAEKLINVR
jgi:DNA repair exonuclease SbcCD nuclease subunit